MASSGSTASELRRGSFASPRRSAPAIASNHRADIKPAFASATSESRRSSRPNAGRTTPFSPPTFGGAAKRACAMPRTQQSRRQRRDDCIARMMRKLNRAEADGRRRAAAFIGHETAGSPRNHSSELRRPHDRLRPRAGAGVDAFFTAKTQAADDAPRAPHRPVPRVSLANRPSWESFVQLAECRQQDSVYNDGDREDDCGDRAGGSKQRRDRQREHGELERHAGGPRQPSL